MAQSENIYLIIKSVFDYKPIQDGLNQALNLIEVQFFHRCAMRLCIIDGMPVGAPRRSRKEGMAAPKAGIAAGAGGRGRGDFKSNAQGSALPEEKV